MKKYLLIFAIMLLVAGAVSCNKSNENKETNQIDASVLGVRLGDAKNTAIDSLDKSGCDFDATPKVSCEVTGPVAYGDVAFATAHVQFSQDVVKGDVVTGISCESAFPESAYPDNGKSAKAFYDKLKGMLAAKYQQYAVAQAQPGEADVKAVTKYDDKKTTVTLKLNYVKAANDREAYWLVTLEIAKSGAPASAPTDTIK